MNGLLGKLVGAIHRDLTPGYVLGEPVPAYDVADVWTLQRASARDGSGGAAAGGGGTGGMGTSSSSSGIGASGGAGGAGGGHSGCGGGGSSGASALAFLFDPARAPTSATAAAGFSGAGLAATPTRAELARAGLTQIKRLKHPDVLRYMTSAEHPDGSIFVATEPATPLATLLQAAAAATTRTIGTHSPQAEQRHILDRESIQWGLFTIARALGFLHQSGLIHGRVNAATIFVTPSGDWKLGGLEAVTQHANAASLSRFVALQPPAYQSPEFANGNWAVVASSAPGAVDSWALGCLMFHAHHGSLSSPDQLRNTSSIPKGLLTAYQKLLASNPTARAPAAQIPTHPYFKSSKFVELNMFVENLALKGELEREAFLTKLPSLMDGLPDGFCTFKVLPMLSQSIEMGRAAAPAFTCVVKMKDRLTEHDFDSVVVKGHATRWYSNAALDRAVRVDLYGKMDIFAKHFDPGSINNAIFPSMAAAFQDAQAPALRDAAVKSVIGIAPALSDKNLNAVLMSHFARLQVDPEPAIRTNTTVCLGRLASRLNQATQNKVLIPAFLRALKDPFPPARAAGGNAILMTSDVYSVKDIATRILPAVAPLLVDQATDVRNLAFKLLATFQPALDRNHAQMTRAGEAAAACATTSTANGAISMGSASHVPGQSSGGSSTGWGLSSLSSMTAALLTTKPNASASSSRAASGGISSDDFKNGAMVRPAKPVSSVSNGSLGGGGGFGRGDAGDSAADGAVGAPRPSARPGGFPSGNNGRSSEDGFGDFHGANEGDDAGDVDVDGDGDGWGDMNVKGGEGFSGNDGGGNGGDGGGVQGEDDFLAMLGPPVSQVQKAVVPGGVSSSRGGHSGRVSKSASGLDPWDGPGRKPAPLLPAAVPTTTGGGLPGGGSGAAAGAGARRGAAKKSGADDWEALLNGDGGGANGGVGGASKRKGLGATRR